VTAILFKKVESRNHLKNGAEPKSQMSREINTINMKTVYTVLIGVTLLIITGCGSTKNLTPSVQRVPAKFDFVPQSQAAIASANMTIVLIKPTFVSEIAEYLVSPFPEMAISMGNDFEELLTAKGFTMRGPFASVDEMVYNDKVNSSFILEIQIDLKPEYTVNLTKHSKTTAANLLLASEPLAYVTYTTDGDISFGGNLVLTALSPQYGEKIWKKNIALDKSTFKYAGTKRWDGYPNMSQQLVLDNGVFNTVSMELDKFYNNALNLVWRQIDPEEMKIVTEQAKKADKKGN
jgi:hypothetical protein